MTEEILARVAETYANAPRYADAGDMIVMNGGRGEFRTSFVRAAGRLLFEGRILERDYVLDVRGKEIVRFEPRHRDMSVNLGIASLTGVTFGAAHVIPRLLWRDVIGGRSILDGPAFVVRASSERIELIFTRSGPMQLVVDPRTWLITSVELDLANQTIATSYKPSL